MVEAGQKEQGAVAQAEAVVVASEQKVPEAPKIDWEAKAKEYEGEITSGKAEITKLRKQVEEGRSQEIQILKQAERDALLKLTAEQTKLNSERTALLAQVVQSQDWDQYTNQSRDLDKRAAALAQQVSQAQATAEIESVRQRALEEIDQINQELGGKFEGHPLFENASLYWRQAMSTGNAYFYERAVAEAHKAAAKIARDEVVAEKKNSAKAIKDAAEAAAKKAKEESGVFELSAGNEAGGAGNLSLDDLVAKDTRKMSFKELAAHDRALEAAMRRG